MQVSFNPNVNFKQQLPAGTVAAIAQSTATPVVVAQPEKKPSGFRNTISNVAKFFTTLGEMTKATLKAVGYAAMTGTVFAAGFWTFGTLPRGLKKGNSLADAIKHPIKNLSKKGKIITSLAMLGVAAFHLIKGKLTANQRTANVDHQLKTGHRV